MGLKRCAAGASKTKHHTEHSRLQWAEPQRTAPPPLWFITSHSPYCLPTSPLPGNRCLQHGC
uniref:Uncharacterized protein n=1 Tax=Anguilla anguilla TaxID=7936 RepID=A0A0E9T3J3_ANGAN